MVVVVVVVATGGEWTGPGNLNISHSFIDGTMKVMISQNGTKIVFAILTNDTITTTTIGGCGSQFVTRWTYFGRRVHSG